MFSKIVELFNQEISLKHREKSLLETMIHENPVPKKVPEK